MGRLTPHQLAAEEYYAAKHLYAEAERALVEAQPKSGPAYAELSLARDEAWDRLKRAMASMNAPPEYAQEG
jgi:hypothetical protein